MVRNADESKRSRVWIVYRRRARIFTILVITFWWPLFARLANAHQPPSESPLWAQLLISGSFSIIWSQFVTYSNDAEFLGRSWTGLDLFRLAVWKGASLYIPLLVVSIGTEEILSHQWLGFLWLICAGITALIGTQRLRSAEGIKPRPVKSGELYKRTLILSKRAGIHLRQVCVIPPGKGHLTNAYGGGSSIAVTEDYHSWLRGPELDFVIGHELAHVKHKHGPKKLTAIAGIFGVPGVFMFSLPQVPLVWSAAIGVTATLVSLSCIYLVSRRFEYTADRDAWELIGDAEAGIRALNGLYAHNGVPPTSTWIEEVFSTHPSLSRRLLAIERGASLQE